MSRLIRILFLAVLLSTTAVCQINVPAGTRMRVQIETSVDTKTSHVGDAVQALLIEPVQNGGSILVPGGTRLGGRVTAVSAEDKKKQTHALLQLSFDEMVLPDGRKVKMQASIQSLGINEQVDTDGVASIHPFSHDFALKAGRRVWLRINTLASTETAAAVAPTVNQVSPSTGNTPVPRSRDDKTSSRKLGDLLITLQEMEDPAVRPKYETEADRHEVLITGTLKNVGKNPVCTLIQSHLETSFTLDEPTAIRIAGRDGGLIRELLPTEQIDAQFTSSVKNGTNPLRLKVSQSEPEQGCGQNSHHIFWTDVEIPLAGLPILMGPPRAQNDGSDRTNDVLKVGAGVSPPRLLRHVAPEFSKEARKGRHEGTVVVRVTVGTDGGVHDPHVVRSLGWGLDEKAIEAVSQWIFDPAVKDGRRVAVYVDIEVNFRLGSPPR